MQLSRLISGLVYGGSLGLMICLAGCQRSAGQQDGVSGAPAAPFIAGVSAGNDDGHLLLYIPRGKQCRFVLVARDGTVQAEAEIPGNALGVSRLTGTTAYFGRFVPRSLAGVASVDLASGVVRRAMPLPDGCRTSIVGGHGQTLYVRLGRLDPPAWRLLALDVASGRTSPLTPFFEPNLTPFDPSFLSLSSDYSKAFFGLRNDIMAWPLGRTEGGVQDAQRVLRFPFRPVDCALAPDGSAGAALVVNGHDEPVLPTEDLEYDLDVAVGERVATIAKGARIRLGGFHEGSGDLAWTRQTEGGQATVELHIYDSRTWREKQVLSAHLDGPVRGLFWLSGGDVVLWTTTICYVWHIADGGVTRVYDAATAAQR